MKWISYSKYPQYIHYSTKHAVMQEEVRANLCVVSRVAGNSDLTNGGESAIVGLYS